MHPKPEKLSSLPSRLLAVALAIYPCLGGCGREDRAPPQALEPEPVARPDAAAVASPTVAAAGLETLPVAALSQPRPGEKGGRRGGKGFVDITRDSGIRHSHLRGVFDPKLNNIMPWIASIGAAAAVADYDGDGDADLYVTTSRSSHPNALYRNDGTFKFTDVARSAGVADVNSAAGVSMDAAFADLDNDGDQDLYVAKWGANQLLRNNADGTFTDVTVEAGAGDRGNANCVLPFDFDGDGLLDLYIANYFPLVDLMKLATTRIMHDSFEAARNGGANVLYHNRGGLRFEDVSHSLRLDDSGWSLDAGISDIDNDGDVDLYVANDFGQDKVFLNSGKGVFTDVTLRAIGRETFKGMNVDFGDFNGDGFTDAYVTNITTAEYLKEGNFLWLNGGDGTFTSVSSATGTGDGGWGWGGRFLDYDNDGDLDILTVNGFVTAGAETYWESLATVAVNPAFEPADASQWPAMGSASLSGNEPARLFRNRGDGAFEEVAAAEGIDDRRDGRGIALADFDGDGDLDVYLANQGAPGALYRNDAGAQGRFVLVTLAGTRSNRDAIGARVQLTASGGSERLLRLTREVNAVNSFASQSSLTLHFGVGSATTVERLTVFWPSGVVQDFRGLSVDTHYRITESGEPMAAADRADYYFARAREARDVAGAGAEESPAVILDLEAELRRKPRSARLANRYRRECVERGYFERSIELFRGLIRERGGYPALRLDLALALVDKIPSLFRDVMAQGSTAKESLRELALVQERYPRSYAVHYITAMNHLYWPSGLLHFDRALRHFEVCLAMQSERTAAGRRPEAYYAEVICAMGDAHAKGAVQGKKDPGERQQRLAKAREYYARGLAQFPGHPVLAKRAELADEDLCRVVTEERGLERRINTDLDMLLEENGLAEAEAEILAGGLDRQLLNAYRLEAFELDATERAVKLFSELASASTTPAEIHVHLALALRDRTLSAGAERAAGAEVFARIDEELSLAEAMLPGDWLPPYLRGLARLGAGGDAAWFDVATASLATSVERSRGGDGKHRVPYPAMLHGDALGAAGDVASARRVWRAAAADLPGCAALRLRLEAGDPSLPSLVRAELERGLSRPIDLEELADHEAEIAALEAALRAAPSRDAFDQYRRAVLRSDEPERAIEFLRTLVAERPRSAAARVGLALALLDRCPDRELGSVRRGLLSSEALDVLADPMKAFPESWGLHYLVGIIHLNWFTKLKHVPLAIEELERCAAIQRRQGKEKDDPYHALTYQALGDAHVKVHRFAEGRMRHWKPGLDVFPDDPGLNERMDLTALMVDAFVEERRSWDSPQDTWLLSRRIGDLADF